MKKKNTRGRKGKTTAKLQISEDPQQKENPGHRTCWSDSDEPQSKFVNFDSERAANFNKDEPEYFESVLRVHKSVVSLVATADGWRMFCSGTVIDHVGEKTWILTSATLVRKPTTQFEVYRQDDIKIEVILHNEQTATGSLEMCDLHYNIAIPRPVVALGRDVDSKAFLVKCGKLVRKNIELDCKELVVCMCDITKDFVGGPVMDSQKRFLGITYSYEKSALYLPVEIAARCINYFKKERTIPWLRIRGQALHTLALDVLESLSSKFDTPPSGILIDKICDMSTENCGGIEVGDIISKLDGDALYSVAQFTAMFLDKKEAAMDTLNTVIIEAIVQRPMDKTSFVAKLNVQEVASDEHDNSIQNRWMHWKHSGYNE
ncbi:unnamed protein product [Urochloa decumbens]|uniref:PDZ domain-containing protein n=1 Tax=Urochloa decumbens TaxID=240449 RepID=A0ABC8WKJ8_9POAL